MSRSMEGKVCLVTGATSGIGEATARALAGMGATVVVAGRNPEKCAAVVERLRAETGNETVGPLVADLSSRADVRRMTGEVLERYPRLDVLVNNAGAGFARRQVSVDDVEMTFALNHLGPFLLTNLLLDRLKASAPARVVVVASVAHRMSWSIDFDDLERRQSYANFRAYGLSKLANILFARELARRLEGTGVTANAMHPGLVATNFGNNLGRFAPYYFRHFGITPEQGADTAVYLATSPEVEGVTGRYFFKRKMYEPSRLPRNETAAKRLWEVSERMTGLGE